MQVDQDDDDLKLQRERMMNQIVLVTEGVNVSFSVTGSGTPEFKESLKDQSHIGLQMLIADAKLSAEQRTGVFNELVARAWRKLDADARKDVSSLLALFRQSALTADGL